MTDLTDQQNIVPLDDLLRDENEKFIRRRYTTNEPTPCVHASRDSQEYISLFWKHLRAAVDEDRQCLGMSVIEDAGGDQSRFNVHQLYERLTAKQPPPGEEEKFKRTAAVVAIMMMMSRVLNGVTQAFADDLLSPANKNLPFDLDGSRFVSLRTLMPLKRTGGAAGNNAPTLVMGGTDTAIKFCWNLLLRAPDAFFELEQRPASRADIEIIWRDTRELIFRIGSGALVSFVALASACTSDDGATLWPQTMDLSLMRRDDRYLWCANESFQKRFYQLLDSIRDEQQGEYVGCAALYTRVEQLPLPDEFDNEGGPQETVAFSELLRWITAIAESVYFAKIG